MAVFARGEAPACGCNACRPQKNEGAVPAPPSLAEGLGRLLLQPDVPPVELDLVLPPLLPLELLVPMLRVSCDGGEDVGALVDALLCDERPCFDLDGHLHALAQRDDGALQVHDALGLVVAGGLVVVQAQVVDGAPTLLELGVGETRLAQPAVLALAHPLDVLSAHLGHRGVVAHPDRSPGGGPGSQCGPSSPQ
eukprot:CAMPEP_0206253218 /NCGR_PEP_ID=MMETSP0047_2-20121206/23036_1 /ASSEMBLY_ACC=CAM_ASM_000192 /TAXON_ID=195065 /ORGANISM="Chroomonas mesostigmatica_cf, Strain CCMP1168" /LENGTH=193 /DNA_ID=CAMNT_0053679415 /DNA_START=140 /DNA_END=719 /DNA_ORIENTATION=-